jgi:hypothetical protein
LDLDKFAEFIGPFGVAFADDLGLRLEDAEQFALGPGIALQHPLAA